MKTTLIYVHDPMCSWCWGFESVRQALFDAVSDRMEIRRLVGGLAADSSEDMSKAMQEKLQQIWLRIEQTIPGTQFNYDFWRDCFPRRSTYPSNRAVIAARKQGQAFDSLMTKRIQQAYYLEARNPSDNHTLIALAADIGLNADQFATDLTSDITESLLHEEIRLTRSLGINSFPSLVVEKNGSLHPVKLDYNEVKQMLTQITKI